MKTRAAVVLLKLALTLPLAAPLAGCGASAPGKLMVDTPILPFVAPDTDELSGKTGDDDDKEATEAPEAAPATPAPTPGKK
jgi:hypothetical protein